MTPPRRPLAGCFVNLSISEGEDSEGHGFPASQVNRATLQIVAAMLGHGAGVVFGHDWREDGVMEAVHGFVTHVHPFSSPTGVAQAEPNVPMRNLLAWPDQPLLSASDRERLSSTLRIESVGLPEALAAASGAAAEDARLWRYLRARGLTHMRHRLDALSTARICMGGRRRAFHGRYPGVVEEALLALTGNKPLYLVGLLGGAVQQLIDAIHGKPMPPEFCPETDLRDIYSEPPVTEPTTAFGIDRMIDREHVWSVFRNAGVPRIAATNKLSIAENEELASTLVLDRAIELMLKGLAIVCRDSEVRA